MGSGNELPTMPGSVDTATVGAGMAGDTGAAPEHELETHADDDTSSDDTSEEE